MVLKITAPHISLRCSGSFHKCGVEFMLCSYMTNDNDNDASVMYNTGVNVQ